jgi:hypothetical protein
MKSIMNSHYLRAAFKFSFYTQPNWDSYEKTLQLHVAVEWLNKFVHLLEVFPRIAIRKIFNNEKNAYIQYVKEIDRIRTGIRPVSDFLSGFFSNPGVPVNRYIAERRSCH